MIYFALGFMAFVMCACAVCCVYLFRKYEMVLRMCERNLDFISRHAAVHAQMEENQEEVAGKIAEQIEKKWDEGLSKMLSWNPYVSGNESEGV